MGEELEKPGLKAEERNEFMKALLRDVRALERMLEENHFETGIRRVGAEQEMFLVDSSYRPAPINDAVLGDIDDERFVTELGKFNMEFNAEPNVFEGDCLRKLEAQLDECLSVARQAAGRHDADIALTGILPTLLKTDLSLENMTDRTRYHVLNEAMSEIRGETAYDFNIQGIDEFRVKHESVMLEAANTSFQIHFQVEPDEFATLYNIAQMVAAPVMALSTYSPLLFGKRLWHETRIALFQQSVDTRSTDLHHRELQPRVTFGNKWVEESVLEIYKEDIARFRLLFGVEVDEDPFEELDAGRVPHLDALCLHNGTVYRWNRACYGISNDQPHLRIENRVMPSGPTPLDEVANSAFWFGLMSGFLVEYGDPSETMDFDIAKTNFFAAAREGLAAPLTWMDGQTFPAGKLIQGKLLPLAAEGLKRSGIDEDDIERYLGVIDRRIQNNQSGSQWMLDSFHSMDEDKGLGERLAAITKGMVRRTAERKPISEWSLANVQDNTPWEEHYLHLSQYMRSDFFTVNDDEIVDLVTNVMNWEHLRHVPVEDNEHRLKGMVTHRTLLELLAEQQTDMEEVAEQVSVADVMIPVDDLVVATPDTTTLEAIEMMRKHEISALPVVADREDYHLVGLVTEREFMNITRELLSERLARAPERS